MPFKAAIVGTGIFATDTHLPTFNQIPEIVPVGAYNRTRAKAEAFAEKAQITTIYDDLEGAFADPNVDFVDALLPVQFNLDVVKLAIKHNKPLALEKPIAATLAQAAEIVRLAEATAVPIAILENWAFLKAVGAIRAHLPKIGEVISFNYRLTGPFNDTNKYLATSWRQTPQHVGGYLSDGGVHQLTLLTEILGPVAQISAYARQVRAQSGADDVLFSSLQLQSGAIGTFTYGSAFGAVEKKLEFIIYGTNGSVVYTSSPSLKNPTITVQYGENASSASTPETTELHEVDTYVQEFLNFKEVLEGSAAVAITPRKAFHHLAIVDAALKSAASGRAVPIAEP